MCSHSSQGTIKYMQDASKSQGVYAADRILLVQLCSVHAGRLKHQSRVRCRRPEGQGTGGAATACEAPPVSVQHRRSVWTRHVLSKRQGEDVQLFQGQHNMQKAFQASKQQLLGTAKNSCVSNLLGIRTAACPRTVKLSSHQARRKL